MVKVIGIEGGKTEEEEIYVNPAVFDQFKHAQEWIEAVGCGELQIILTSGCMSFSEVFDTQERTEAGLGAMKRYTDRYARELDNEWEEE